jgi:adenylylsulfate kinase-like enzyme
MSSGRISRAALRLRILHLVYRLERREVRALIRDDRFVLLFVGTPLEECERRDPEGLYAKARQGQVKNFTGPDDRYERPTNADLVFDTTHSSPADNGREIVAQLLSRGLLGQESREGQTIDAHHLNEPADQPGRLSAFEQG